MEKETGLILNTGRPSCLVPQFPMKTIGTILRFGLLLFILLWIYGIEGDQTERRVGNESNASPITAGFSDLPAGKTIPCCWCHPENSEENSLFPATGDACNMHGKAFGQVCKEVRVIGNSCSLFTGGGGRKRHNHLL